jgi:drug/metabolite transporter (DMT)-like permease
MLAIPLELSPVLVAVAGAASYGSGDFLGGRAATRLSPSGAVAIAQCTAMAFAVQTFFSGQFAFSGQDVAASGMVAGIAYAIGLMYLYQGIAQGRVAVVAPVCGVVGILVPLIGDLMFGRDISSTQVLGIGICAAAIVLLSHTTDSVQDGRARHFSFRVGAISGMGYGTADMTLGLMAPEDAAASFMVARTVAALISIALICLAMARARRFWKEDAHPASIAGGLAWVQRPHLAAMAPFIVLAMLAGIFDAIGHMSYVHVATQGGSMAVTAALIALFPAVVIGLAVVFLNERILPGQYWGLAASLAGILVLSI